MSGRLREIARQDGAFAEALRTADRFDHVVFAIRDGLPGWPVYRAFADRFAGSVPDTARCGGPG
ncbi:hypothetical protein ACK8GG_06770 [Micromonosporaceae bacterium DT55]|uniref:hypothetical protein n=1 Tax=Melissospora conviva TaxID=3388432 RepID=UPI003C14DB1F